MASLIILFLPQTKKSYIDSITKEQQKTSTLDFSEKMHKEIQEFREKTLHVEKMTSQEQQNFVKQYLKIKDAVSKVNSKELSFSKISTTLERYGLDEKNIKDCMGGIYEGKNDEYKYRFKRFKGRSQKMISEELKK